MSDVEIYIYQYEGEQRDTLLYLDFILTSLDFDLTPKIKYKIPFYYHKSWICYLNPPKDRSVEFAFTRGNELSNANGLLSSNGRKQVSSVMYKSRADINKEQIFETIHEALLLDESVPYASKRK